MIPPFKSNHASFIELLPNGDLVLAWFSGTAEGESDVAIVLSRLPNGTDQWSRAAVLSQRKDFSNQNPVLFYDAKGKMLHLYHTQQPASGIARLPTAEEKYQTHPCLLYTSPSPRDRQKSRMPSSA